MRHYLEPNGSITVFGYRRLMQKNRRQKFDHVLVWEKVNGPVPAGKELHHINGNKLDNRIENLRLVTRLEHKRIHSGCELRDGVWWKPCRRCGVFQPADVYYKKPDGIFHICRKCAIARAVEYKRIRKQKARMLKVIAAGGGLKNSAIHAVDKQTRNGEAYGPQETPGKTGVGVEGA